MEDKKHSVTVAVVAICGAAYLARCLDAIAAQQDAPPFDVVVVCDPHLTDIPPLREYYPHVRMIVNEGQRTPLELASRAIHEATGDLILLTKDHCEPRHDWVRRLCEAQTPDRAAVGGIVETDADASLVDWAFYYFDFYRYAKPVPAGPSPTLTVCNVAYRRAYLDEIVPMWKMLFHETAINDALRDRFGPLWLNPEAEVKMRRHVHLVDAVYERYAFGRLFGCTRINLASPGRRAYHTALAPVIPFLLLGRMTVKAFAHRRTRHTFIRALPALTLMVLAWSWGEWLGYVTRHRPRSMRRPASKMFQSTKGYQSVGTSFKQN
jgi:hypothetical protein